MKSGRNIDVDSKGTFKWVENSLEKGWKRRFWDRLGLSGFKLSHPSLEPISSGLHLSELPLTDRLIRLVGCRWVGRFLQVRFLLDWPNLNNRSPCIQRNIAQLAKVKVMRKHGSWQELHIHHSIRSIICLNLPSFSGGLNPWGTPNSKKKRDRELTPPFVDDGLLEIVGFRDAWHGLVLLAPNGHGTRLAQARRIRFEFHKGACDHTFMRIDGEPWKQPLPVDDDTVVVEISHLGQVNMLATHDCKSKSINDPKTTPSHHNDEEEDSNEEDTTEDREEFRKFGAADTFKIPDEIDISRLS